MVRECQDCLVKELIKYSCCTGRNGVYFYDEYIFMMNLEEDELRTEFCVFKISLYW